MSGFSNPIVGGSGNLIRANIQSPNFSIAEQTGWSIGKDGNAYFYNITTAGNVIITNDSGVFVYSGQPNLGNLIGSFGGAAGFDTYGNLYPQGLSVGIQGTSNIQVIPNAQTPVQVTSLIAGTLLSLMQLNTADVNQVIPAMIGALQLNTGNATKQSAIFSSPFTTTGAAMVLESTNDGNTDVPVISFGLITTPDQNTIIFTPLASLTPYAFILYGASSGQTTITHTSGSGNFSIPVGVTSAKAEVNATGAAGKNGTGTQANGGGGSGGYSCEPALVVPSGGTAAYVVGATPAAGSNGNGAVSSIQGSSVLVKANGGVLGSGSSGGVGGAAGTNTISFAGANGGNGLNHTGSTKQNVNFTYNAVHTYSYEGGPGDSSPAPGYNPFGRINVDGVMMQGDDQLGDNGNCSTVIVMPWQTMQNDLAGVTFTSITLKLTNQHSWYGSGMKVALGWLTYAGSFGTSRNFGGWGVSEDITEWHINQGQTLTQAINLSYGTVFANDNATAFLLYQPSSDRNYYGYFTGGSNPQLKVSGTIGGTVTTGGGGGGAGGATNTGNGVAGLSCTDGNHGGAGEGGGGNGGNSGSNGNNASLNGSGGGGGGYGVTNGGAGGGGYAKLSYSSGAPPILMSIASAAGTDQFGSAYPIGLNLNVAGTTADPTLITTDTWHTLTLINGWTGTCKYRMQATGRVEIWVAIQSSAATAFQFGTMPAGYIPGSTNYIAAGSTGDVSSVVGPFIQVTNTGVISMNGLSAFSTSGIWVAGGTYPLGVV